MIYKNADRPIHIKCVPFVSLTGISKSYKHIYIYIYSARCANFVHMANTFYAYILYVLYICEYVNIYIYIYMYIYIYIVFSGLRGGDSKCGEGTAGAGGGTPSSFLQHNTP